MRINEATKGANNEKLDTTVVRRLRKFVGYFPAGMLIQPLPTAALLQKYRWFSEEYRFQAAYLQKYSKKAGKYVIRSVLAIFDVFLQLVWLRAAVFDSADVFLQVCGLIVE